MKSIEHITKQGAENLGISHELFKDVYGYYWKNYFIDNTVNANYTSIYLHKFGTYRFSMPKVIRQIQKVITDLKKSNAYWKKKGVPKTENAEKTYNEKIKELKQLLSLHNSLAIESHKLRGGMISTSWQKKSGKYYKTQYKKPTNELKDL